MLAGLMAEKAGNIPGAFEALRRSVALAPDWGPGLLELSLLLARQNQFKEAIETAEKVAALEPKNLQVLAGVIDIAHRASHLEMAVCHLRRGLDHSFERQRNDGPCGIRNRAPPWRGHLHRNRRDAAGAGHVRV